MLDTTVIWKTNPDNAWRLYTHTNFKLHDIQLPKETKDKKTGPTGKSQLPTPFSFSKLKPMTKGSIACTSKGYGIIQSFNEDRGTITVKIEGQIHDLPENEVLTEVPLDVVFLHNSLKIEETLYIPTFSTLNEVIEKLETSLADSESHFSVSLFFKGKELEGSNETIEKLKIMPWSKLLGVVKLKKPLSIKRYTQGFSGWNLSSGNIVGLSFMPSKTIRIIGFAIYKPSQGVLNAVATLYSGSSIKSDVLWSKSISTQETTDKEEIEKIMFNKPYTIKEGQYGSISLTFTSQCMSHYGNGGKQTQEAEGDFSFTFKVPEDMPSHMNGYDAGQFPELYYYV